MTIAPISNLCYDPFSRLQRIGSSIVYATVYTIMNLATRILGTAQMHTKYVLLSDFYWNRAMGGSNYIHRTFGDFLINPAVNQERLDTLTCPIDQGKLDALFKEKARQMPASLRLDKSRLPLQKTTKGACLAASLEFLKKYFERIKKEKDPQKVIQSLSAEFKEGVSEKTALINYLQEAEVNTSSPTNIEKIQATSNLYRLNIQSIKSHGQPIPRDLKDGGYIVLVPSHPIGHACAYIKHKKQRFLFDLDIGAFPIPKHLKRTPLRPNGEKVLFFQAY